MAALCVASSDLESIRYRSVDSDVNVRGDGRCFHEVLNDPSKVVELSVGDLAQQSLGTAKESVRPCSPRLVILYETAKRWHPTFRQHLVKCADREQDESLDLRAITDRS
jgi:hypothetical protein